MTQVKARYNPFPGIRSFETDESHLFFGRESQIETIVSVLVQTHFLAIIGSSGSGKSSLIRAGVIPAILKGEIHDQKNWDMTVFKPGDHPITSFATEYAETFNKKANSTGKAIIASTQVEKALRTDFQPVLNAHQQLGSEPWLIVIDQFEEIFRYQKEANAAVAKNESILFINLFLDLVQKQDTDIPIYVILTMRSDFLDQCTELPGLTEALNKGHFLIPRMTPQSLQDAIVKPIREFGDEISDELVNRLISDLGDQSDQLPVMQHALMRAWDYWNVNRVGDQPLELLHYEAVGTISSALSLHAEEIFNELKKDELKNDTERLFKALTDLGADKRSTRRPTTFADILKVTNSSKNDLIEIIDQFRAPGRAFLMPPHYVPIQPGTVIDISHESFMRVWGRLKDWVDEETKSAELYLRLSKSAELYQQGKSGLWTNPELEIAVKWKQKNKPNPYWADRYDPGFERAIEFLDYSKKESDFEILKKENRQKRELSRARKIVIILSTASIISILFLIIAMNLKYKAEASEEIVVKKGIELQDESKKSEIQRKEAVAQKRIAEQQQKIAEQQKLITEEQRQYAIAQQDSARKSELVAKAAKVLADSSAQRAKRSEIDAKAAKVLAESNARRAKISAEEAISSEKNTERLRKLAIARSMAIQSQRLASTNPVLSALLAGHSYKFNMENGGRKDDPDIFNALSNIADEKPIFIGHKDIVRGVALSKDGNWIFSGSDDGRLLVWSSKDAREKPLSLNTNGLAKKGIRCVAVQNAAVLVGTSDGIILFWDKAEKSISPQSVAAHSGIINKIGFISSNRIVSVGADGFVNVWNPDNLKLPVFSVKMEAQVKDIAVSGDGTKLACVDQNGMVKIFLISNLNDKPIELNTKRPIQSIALDFKGGMLLTGDISGMINLWNLSDQNQNPLEFLDHRSAITSVKFSPDCKTFASSSYDNTIRIWNPEDPKQNPIVIAEHDSWVMDIAFSSDGNHLVSASNDKTVRLFEINTDLLASGICAKVDRNLSENEWITFVGKDIKYQKTCPQITTNK
jgi:WD40 repeat protein/energy-coupling factor transporter ATP-binding protein EcfA2